MNNDLNVKLKRIFKGRQTITPRMKAQLESLGFSVLRKKKHIVIAYGKRQFSVSKTPSDYRSGLNLVTTIIRTVRQDGRKETLP